jgi:hypothetical protein
MLTYCSNGGGIRFNIYAVIDKKYLSIKYEYSCTHFENSPNKYYQFSYCPDCGKRINKGTRSPTHLLGYNITSIDYPVTKYNVYPKINVNFNSLLELLNTLDSNNIFYSNEIYVTCSCDCGGSHEMKSIIFTTDKVNQEPSYKYSCKHYHDNFNNTFCTSCGEKIHKQEISTNTYMTVNLNPTEDSEVNVCYLGDIKKVVSSANITKMQIDLQY